MGNLNYKGYLLQYLKNIIAARNKLPIIRNVCLLMASMITELNSVTLLLMHLVK